MEIAFESLALRAVCESGKKAEECFGGELAVALQGRLADLSAAQSLADLPWPVATRAGEPELMFLTLGDSNQLVFTPNHPTAQTNPEGLVDKSRVTRLRILEVRREDA